MYQQFGLNQNYMETGKTERKPAKELPVPALSVICPQRVLCTLSAVHEHVVTPTLRPLALCTGLRGFPSWE